MKQYDTEKKKWVEIDHKNKKRDRDICRGGKEHDFVLVLPDHISYTDAYKFNPEEYYRIMDEISAFKKQQDTKLEAMGIKPRFWSWHYRKETRMYMCSVCKKKKYEYDKED